MNLSYRNQRNAEITAQFWGKSLDKPDWFEIKAQSENSADEVEIFIYDIIGWPFNSSQEFVTALSEIKDKSLLVRINSPGGDVFDSLAIFNALKSFKNKVITRIESLAGSAASFIALAGQEVQAYKNSMMMIHEPMVFALGNQYDLKDMAEILSKISSNMVDMYADRSNIGKRDIKSMMKAETWFTAKEMKEKDLIDSIVDGEGIKAKFDLSIFSKTPEEIIDQKEGRQLSPREIEQALKNYGASRNFAKAVAVGCSEKPKIIIDANQWDAEIANLMKSLANDMNGGYGNV